MKQTYRGGCQCGKVRFEASAEIGEVMACNCSRCGRLGTLLTFVPKDDFRLLSGSDAVTEYLFNRHAIRHLFCATCGIESFAIGKKPDGQEMVALNARCLVDVDVDSFPVKKVNGKAF